MKPCHRRPQFVGTSPLLPTHLIQERESLHHVQQSSKQSPARYHSHRPSPRPLCRPAENPAPCCLCWSERHASLPRNEVFLRLHLSFGSYFAACDLNNEIENRLAHLLDCLFSGDDRTRIDIDDVVHALRQCRVGRQLHDRSNWIPGRCAETRREQNHTCARSHLCRNTFHIVARRALQVQAWLGRVLWII